MFSQKRRIFLLSLTGCLSTSPGIPGLFLVELQVNRTELIRAVGMCASQSPTSHLKCLPSYSAGESRLADLLLPSNPADPEYAGIMTMLLSLAHALQTKVFHPLLVGSAVLFFLSIISMLLLRRYMKTAVPNASPKTRRLRSAVTVSGQYAFGLAVAAAFSTTQAAGALSFFATSAALSVPASGGSVRPGVAIAIAAGVPLQALQWTVVALLVVLHWSVASMFRTDDKSDQSDDFPSMGMPPPSPPPPGF
ncbi:hypothetical protein DL769_002148 [Monosporascus sp. CRB-8-3]|nr:hypothetical protein DL769_002148 [Monosporascus sp. CRB-8-3]